MLHYRGNRTIIPIGLDGNHEGWWLYLGFPKSTGLFCAKGAASSGRDVSAEKPGLVVSPSTSIGRRPDRLRAEECPVPVGPGVRTTFSKEDARYCMVFRKQWFSIDFHRLENLEGSFRTVDRFSSGERSFPGGKFLSPISSDFPSTCDLAHHPGNAEEALLRRHPPLIFGSIGVYHRRHHRLVQVGCHEERRFAVPIYEYECNDCHCVFERLVFASDEEKPTCPNCSTPNVTKRISCIGWISAAASASSASSCSSSAAGKGFS